MINMEPPTRYLCVFASKHSRFRYAELESVSELCGCGANFSLPYPQQLGPLAEHSASPTESVFLEVDLPSDQVAKEIANRSVTLRNIYEIWGKGATWSEVRDSLQHYPRKKMEPFLQGTFSFSFWSFGRKVLDQNAILAALKHCNIWEQGIADLKNPQNRFAFIENYGNGRPANEEPRYIYICREVAQGSRNLISTFSLKTRPYLGITSMDPELSLIMANHALCRPGQLVFDPFAGTGGLLLPCAYFGAHVIGCDIIPTSLRGTEPGKNVVANFSQLNLRDKLVDLFIADTAHPPFFCSNRTLFDAIITDPPYGLRAGAKKVGTKETLLQDEPKRPPGPGHWSKTIEYGVPEMLKDLLLFASVSLNLNGRLVFWLPTSYEFKQENIPCHPCLQLVHSSLQPITSRWGRLLITMVKTQAFDPRLHYTADMKGDFSVFSGFASAMMHKNDYPKPLKPSIDYQRTEIDITKLNNPRRSVESEVLRQTGRKERKRLKEQWKKEKFPNI